MHPLLADLIADFALTGDIPQDACNFLIHHDCPNTAEHSHQVAKTAVWLADRFGTDRSQAEAAAWLHDISAVYPNPQRVNISRQLGIDLLPEETEVPLLLHQKISAIIARDIFANDDQTILAAVRCHTTLKPDPSQLDMLLFTADKLAWDQHGTPPFKEEMLAALDQSLEAAVWVYQNHLWHSGKLKIIHPWMQASYQQLKSRHQLL